MAYDYDVCVIGLGPAGMAVSIMAAHMGLRVVGIERRALGGECMNVGCIPSKALLRMAHARHAFGKLADLALEDVPPPAVTKPFDRIAEHLRFIDEKKTAKMFEKVDLRLREGSASFVDRHTIAIGELRVSAKKVFICTGARPAVPAIAGLDAVNYLTNETVFQLDRVPESLVIIGGGAIGCEIGQALSRLGSRVSIVHMDSHLLPQADWDAGQFLERVFQEEGIAVYNGRTIRRVHEEDGSVAVATDRGEMLRGERLLLAAGRKPELSSLNLKRAGVACTERGIRVDRTLRTTQRNIYAPGDCNGTGLFSHAAMHQGMIALINSIAPWPLKRNFRRYVVPWAVFTDPPIAHVGWLEHDLRQNDLPYETVVAKYEDYGAAIAQGLAVGSVTAYVSDTGRIYGVRIIGEGASEMINEWGLAIQNHLRIHKILFLQHAFPSMSFLTKRVAEGWTMNRVDTPLLRRMIKALF